MRRLVMIGLVSLVAAGGCIVGNYGTELSVTSSAGASSSGTSSSASSSSGSSSSSSGALACPSDTQKAVEICNNGTDEGGDDIVCDLKPEWAKRFGDAQDQSVLGLQIHQDGTAFLGGSFSGNIDLEPNLGVTTLLVSPAASGYIGSLSKDGNGLWIKKHDELFIGTILGLALGNTDVFAVGSTKDAAGADSAILQQLTQMGGMPTTSQSWGSFGSKLVRTTAVAFAPGSVNGNFAVTAGVYEGTGNDPCTLSNNPILNAATPISVILKHNPSTLACQKSLILPALTTIPPGNNKPTSIAVNGAAEVVVTGTYEGSLGNLESAATNSGKPASYVLKTNVNLEVRWHKEFIAQGGSFNILDVAVSLADEQIFVTGWMIGTVEPIPGKTYTSDDTDLFVMAMNSSNGNVQWFSLVKGPGDAIGQSIVEYGNEVYVAGRTDGIMGVQVNPEMPGGSGAICTAMNTCLFLMKFDRTCGDAAWAMQLGAVTPIAINGPRIARLAASDAGLLLGLTWNGAMDLGNGPITPDAGGTDIILAKFFTPKP